ncbi:MAG: hypothetical protein F7B60_04760 [Desulfurococcales archaeon]|nr:hypothetical protein [Desulfurococcales archaeon]
MTINSLNKWMDGLGVVDRTVILKKPSKRVALVLSSIVCRNIKSRYDRKLMFYDKYLGINLFLRECGCDYEEASDPCEADIIILKQLSKGKIPGNPRLIIVEWTRGFQGYSGIDIVLFTQTVKPSQYVMEVNNVKFLVKLSKCSIGQPALEDEKRTLLNLIRKTIDEYGYIDQDAILRIVSSFYNVSKSHARHIMYEMAKEGLLILGKDYVEIPYYE